MQQWLKISLLLCIFGFLKELKPSEPFIVDYLSGHWRNVTADEVLYSFIILSHKFNVTSLHCRLIVTYFRLERIPH